MTSFSTKQIDNYRKRARQLGRDDIATLSDDIFKQLYQLAEWVMKYRSHFENLINQRIPENESDVLRVMHFLTNESGFHKEILQHWIYFHDQLP